MEVAGKGGSIACAGLTKGVKAWSLNLVGDTLETTDYADSGHKTYIAGLDGWTGSCEVNWDTANTISIGDTIAALIFSVVGDTEKYTGAAIVTGISVSSSVDGLVTMSVSFQGSGACTLTSAA
jgi:predicted secreted protein